MASTEDKKYQCRKCRTQIFAESDIEQHTAGPGQTNFTYKKRDRNTNEINCNSWFLKEAMPWMGDVTEPEGKLACPKCAARIGSYKWCGAQCSCGPAMQVTKSRVDEAVLRATVAIRAVPAAAARVPTPAEE